MKIRISPNFAWLGGGVDFADEKMVFDVQASPDDWLILGKKKGYYIANVSSTLPPRFGTHLIISQAYSRSSKSFWSRCELARSPYLPSRSSYSLHSTTGLHARRTWRMLPRPCMCFQRRA